VAWLLIQLQAVHMQRATMFKQSMLLLVLNYIVAFSAVFHENVQNSYI